MISEMLNTGIVIDTWLFSMVNTMPHSFLLDQIALFLSGIGSYGLVWLVIGLVMFLREERRNHMAFLPLLSGLATSYILSDVILKPIIGRIRPVFTIGALLVEGDRMGDIGIYSFPSSHATIAFALSTVLSDQEPRYRGLWYLLAIGIALSRVYLGRHYPSDIVGGAILGYLIGLLVVRIRRAPQTTGKRGTRSRSRSGIFRKG